MIKDKFTSHLRKEKGQAFQYRCKKYIVETFFRKFSHLVDNKDITSCPSCVHGEDLWLSNELREILPVSIECKYRATDYKHINKNYDQAVEQTRKLARTDSIIPLLFIKRGTQDALAVLRIQHLLDLYLELAEVKEQLQEKQYEHI